MLGAGRSRVFLTFLAYLKVCIDRFFCLTKIEKSAILSRCDKYRDCGYFYNKIYLEGSVMKNSKVLTIIVILVASLVWSVMAFATDCRIVSTKQMSGDGTNEDWKIVFSFEDIQGGQLLVSGQRAPNDTWIEYPVAIVNGLGEVVIRNWPAGEPFEFSYYTVLNGVKRWTDPSCSAFKYNGHFRVTLGTKFVSKPLSPAIMGLLLDGKKELPPPSPPPVVHQCAVISVQKTATNGAYGDFRITLSLQKFDPAAPANAIPYVDRQSAPDSAWTGWQPVQRVGDTAILVVNNWPITWSLEFSYKLVANGQDYWQDLDDWLGTGCQANYALKNGHFLVPLN